MSNRPEDLGIYNRCSSCCAEWYQCRTQAELGYGRCCFHCDHRSAPGPAGKGKA